MKIAIVCTHGGHLTETLQLLDAFAGYEYFFVTHHSSRDQDVQKIARTYFSTNINANPFRFMLAFPWALCLLLRESPDVIFSMGAEIALPFFFWGKTLRIKTVYLESWCRVSNLSMTGKLSYPFVDAFYVQWPQMLQVCGSRAKYAGAVL